jgi:hypothetical protein
MAIHIIPEGEDNQHKKSPQCECEPIFKLDKESGEMVWFHNIIDYDKIFDDFIVLSISLICLAVGLLL